MPNQKWLLCLLALFLMGFIAVKPAFAMDKHIFNEKKTVLPVNESVDNVIVFGHDIDIKGKVDTSAIVVNGNLKISKTAKINGLVLVLNGTVIQETGAYVKENILAFKFKSDTVNHLLIGAILLFSSWLLRFVISVGLVLLSILIGLLIHKREVASLQTFKRQTGKLLLVGAVGWVALIGISLLLIFTVFGIPIAIILLIPPMLAFLFGTSVISEALGEKLISNVQTADWVKTFAGSFLLVSVYNFPFFGWLMLLCVFCLSNGLMLLWILGKRRKIVNQG